MALIALLLDFVFDALGQYHWIRIARLALALLIGASSFTLTWRQSQVRQTNVDLLAAKVGQIAGKDDLVVVTPWYYGVSFQRYYAGPAPWMSIPPMDFHKVHRYDLVKAQMVMPDQDEPIKPLLARIGATVKGGHRVWVAGMRQLPEPGATVPDLPAAPAVGVGWQADAYTDIWSAKTLAYLQLCAGHMERVPVPLAGPVSDFEDLPLMMFERSEER